MSEQHEDFLQGFADGLGIPLDEVEPYYQQWVTHSHFSKIDLIDYESSGYQCGYETGQAFWEEMHF